jgi:hypothetical protein
LKSPESGERRIQVAMPSRPRYQVDIGGIEKEASSARSETTSSTSPRCQAST